MPDLIPHGLIVALSAILVYHIHWNLSAERVICNISLADKYIIIDDGGSNDYIISYSDNGIIYDRHIWIFNSDSSKYYDCLQYLSKWHSSSDCQIYLIYPGDTIPCYFKGNDIFGLHLNIKYLQI